MAEVPAELPVETSDETVAGQTQGETAGETAPASYNIAALGSDQIPGLSGASSAPPYIQLAQASSGEAPAARDEAVRSRLRPEYDPLGFTLGPFLLPEEGGLDILPAAMANALSSFNILPKLDNEVSYQSNIFRREFSEDIKSDRILRITPALDIKSEWSRHALNFHGDYVFGYYDRYNGEDYQDFNLTADATLEVLDNSKITPKLGHKRGHEQRGTADDPGSNRVRPTYFETFARVEGEYNNTLFLLRPTLQAKKYNFLNAGSLHNDDRDRWDFEGTLRVGYEAWKATTLFIEPKLVRTDYVLDADDNNLDRDARRIDVQAGITYDLSGVSFLELSAGYMRQNFEDSQLRTIEGPTFTGKLIWNVTELITLTGGLGRSIQDTTVLGTSGILASEASLQADYEMLYNLLLNASGKYRNEDFIGIARDDAIWNAGGGLRYLVGQHLVLDGSYLYEKKNAHHVHGSSYEDNVFSLKLRLQM